MQRTLRMSADHRKPRTDNSPQEPRLGRTRKACKGDSALFSSPRAVELIELLDGVRQAGTDQWIARCPAHNDRSPSLAIRRTDDRWLIHCFAGCSVTAICRALRLELADLFDGRHPRRNDDRHRLHLSPADRLDLIEHEVLVATILLADVLEKKAVTEADWHRLAQAAARIGRARYV